MNLQRFPNPLSNAPREGGVEPALLILHATEGASAMSSIDDLRTMRNSYHFVIARHSKDSPWAWQADGSESVIDQCDRYQHRVPHVAFTIPCQASSRHINDHSVAVSLGNFHGKLKQCPYPGPKKYTDQQALSLNGLLTLAKQNVPILTHLTTHAVIQPWNPAAPARFDGKFIAARMGWEWWHPS